MKCQGEIVIWFWLRIIADNVVFLYAFLYSILFEEDSVGAMIMGIVLFNLICIPIVARNYVIVSEISVTVYFGFLKESIMLRDITEVRRTHDIIASTAASLDRISINGRWSGLMCAVKDKEGFFKELKRKNPNIKMYI